MARYQLLRPSPVKVFPRRVRREDAAASTAPKAQESEGPKSPESPHSPPGGRDSESEDEAGEPPSLVESKTAISSVPPPPPPPLAPSAAAAPQSSSASSSSAVTTSTPPNVPSETPLPSTPAFTVSFTSQGNQAGVPQVTGTPSLVVSSRPPVTTTPAPSFSSIVVRLSSSSSNSSPTSSPTSSSFPTSSMSLAPAQSETAGQQAPQRSRPQEERTLITKGAAAAAITLSILGGLAIVVAAIIWFKRHKRRQLQYNRRLADDAFDPSNTGSLRAPETAHRSNSSPIFGGTSAAGGSHLTRSTDRSNTLFGAAPYERPETVSTDRNKSRFPIAPPQTTPNPFADPPLNKAYDVLAGRPRSTTLTNRGSWVKNPFKDPESERFDPFGELQEKARRERRKYVEESMKQAELAREAELIKEYETKEAMGLGVPEGSKVRKGSGVTVEGLGVLDRSGGSSGYR
ncbi:hypothetical protein EK21DRAFT_75927 [Setomelanomma holmii]|uniref:Uncharacterized protein n=1 Tax=Setomelanomma holmii TaxID=210430 RepID=A0A9P4H259_9PLEO|nr:hypothetical protein EK21DRAFT_75927 [Setomelanomma holmii]